jgi:serine/threonine protein kinase
MAGSVFWMAPEVVKQTSYTRKADIWSCGCLIVEMLTSEHPYANLTQMQAIFRVNLLFSLSLFVPKLSTDSGDENSLDRLACFAVT